MPHSVSDGAKLKCDQGSAPGTLQITSHSVLRLNGKLLATINDYQAPANIGSLGICRILTQTAQGTPTACSAVISAAWMNASTGHKIDGQPLLTDQCTCLCSIGGTISIQDPNTQRKNTLS